MERVMDGIRRFAERDWTMAEKALALAGCFLLGVAGGFCLAPIKQGISLAPITGIRIIMDIRGMERQAAEKNPNARSKRRMKSAVQGPVYPAPCGGDKDLQ